MSLLRSFFSLNRRICQALARRFPDLLDLDSYHDLLGSRISADLATMTGGVLEVGGIDRPLLEKGARTVSK